MQQAELMQNNSHNSMNPFNRLQSQGHMFNQQQIQQFIEYLEGYYNANQ